MLGSKIIGYNLKPDTDYRVKTYDFKRPDKFSKDQIRTMSVLLRSRRRLAWLSVNIVLNLIAASVIALYQETLQAVIALAVFLPIIVRFRRRLMPQQTTRS